MDDPVWIAICRAIKSVYGMRQEQITRDVRFEDFGEDSLEFCEVSLELENSLGGAAPSHRDMYDFQTIGQMEDWIRARR